jgi:hypothetical protein
MYNKLYGIADWFADAGRRYKVRAQLRAIVRCMMGRRGLV